MSRQDFHQGGVPAPVGRSTHSNSEQTEISLGRCASAPGERSSLSNSEQAGISLPRCTPSFERNISTQSKQAAEAPITCL